MQLTTMKRGAHQRLITTQDQFLEYIAPLLEPKNKIKLLAVDVETDGVRVAFGHEICGIALAYKFKGQYHSCYVSIRHEVYDTGPSIFESDTVENLDPKWTLDTLKPILENPEIVKVAHNAKFEYQCFIVEGIDLNPLHCTMILSNLIDPSRPNSLKRLMSILLDTDPDETDALSQWFKYHGVKKNEAGFKFVPLDLLSPYANYDAIACLRIWEKLLADSRFPDRREIYKIEHDLIAPLALMELRGIYCSEQRLTDLEAQLDKHLLTTEQWLYELAGKEFTIRNSEEVGTIIFKEMGLPIPKDTIKGLTDSDVLSKIDHDFCRALLTYRGLDKAKNTYTNGLLKAIHKGKIYARYSQVKSKHSDLGADGKSAGTDTGRLSSSDPNLQNISGDKELVLRDGSKFKIPIRSCFVIPEHMQSKIQYLLPDWSQVEMRVLAELSNDETLLQAFADGRDMHSATAERVFGLTRDEVDPKKYTGPSNDPVDGHEITLDEKLDWVWAKKYRQLAKAVNFGIVYGMGVSRFAFEQGMTLDEAKAFFDKYFGEFPGIRVFNERNIKYAEQNREIKTYFGRVRPLKFSDAYKATNTVIQGTAADMNKIALARVEEVLKPFQSRIINNIHDEITIQHYKEEVEVPRLILDTMQDWPMFGVHVRADMAIAWPTWGDKRDVTEEEKKLYNL